MRLGRWAAGVSGQVRALESETAQPGSHLGAAHEQVPEQTGPVVLDHRDDRALVDGEPCVRIPAFRLAEGVDEAVVAPDAVAHRAKQVADRKSTRLNSSH